MEIKKEQTVAFVGNKSLVAPRGRFYLSLERTIRKQLSILLEECYAKGQTTFISGMVIGWDILCAEEVVKLQSKHTDVRLILALAEEQEARYSLSGQYRYHKLLSQATEIMKITDGASSDSPYPSRNNFMLASSSTIITYYRGTSNSSIASTIRKAREVGIKVVNLYDLIK